MTITVKITPQIRVGEQTSHFVGVFEFDGKKFRDTGNRLNVSVNGVPATETVEALYSEGRAILLVEGWGDGSCNDGTRMPDIFPLIDRFEKEHP